MGLTGQALSIVWKFLIPMYVDIVSRVASGCLAPKRQLTMVKRDGAGFMQAVLLFNNDSYLY